MGRAVGQAGPANGIGASREAKAVKGILRREGRIKDRVRLDSSRSEVEEGNDGEMSAVAHRKPLAIRRTHAVIAFGRELGVGNRQRVVGGVQNRSRALKPLI